MDPLSDILSLLKPHSYMCGGIDAGGDWSIGFDAHESIKCYAISSGGCWLAVDGVADPVRLEAGDCFLLPLGRAFRMTSDLTLPAVNFKTVITMPLQGGIATYQGGGACFGLGGVFGLNAEHAELLVGLLPPIVHIRNDADRAELRWALERMMHEVREPKPGSSLVAQQLASMLFIQALRLHLADAPRGGVGWLFALGDPNMSAALQLMHDDPARRWTLHELAARVDMSRSSFALRFKQTVGTSPMDYLTRWRMLLAAERLTHSNDPVSTIADALGYESESAFSAAFKRIMNCSPRHYSRQRNRAAARRDERGIPGEHGFASIAV